MITRCVALLAGLSLLAACTGSHTAARGPAGSTPAPAQLLTVTGSASFVAVRLEADRGHSAVTVSDARTGRITKVLLPDPWHSMAVRSTAVDAAGHVWVGLATGPTCTSGIASCGPKPNSCASEVVMLTPDADAPHAVFQGGPGELVTDAQPSPDGTLLAYLDGVCDRAYFNQHLRVRSLKTGRSWDIGAGLAPCHALGSMAWTADGRDLVVSYGRSLVTGTPARSLGVGGCSANAPRQLAVVPASTASSGLPGAVADADQGCEITAATATSTGYAAIEACRGPGDAPGNFLEGPARLVRYDKTLRIVGRTPIGRCVDGAELRSDSTGSRLVGTSYQYCAPGRSGAPRTVAFTDTATGLTTIVNAANGGSSTLRAISW